MPLDYSARFRNLTELARACDISRARLAAILKKHSATDEEISSIGRALAMSFAQTKHAIEETEEAALQRQIESLHHDYQRKIASLQADLAIAKELEGRLIQEHNGMVTMLAKIFRWYVWGEAHGDKVYWSIYDVESKEALAHLYPDIFQAYEKAIEKRLMSLRGKHEGKVNPSFSEGREK